MVARQAPWAGGETRADGDISSECFSYPSKRLAQKDPCLAGRTAPTTHKIGRSTPKAMKPNFPFKAQIATEPKAIAKVTM